MCPDGPGSSGQTGHADNGGQYIYMHFKWIYLVKSLSELTTVLGTSSWHRSTRVAELFALSVSVRSSLRAVVRGNGYDAQEHTDTGVKLVIEASLIVYVSITMLRLIVRRRKCESSSNHAIKDPQCVVIDFI